MDLSTRRRLRQSFHRLRRKIRRDVYKRQVIAWRQLAAAGVFLATNPASSFFYVFTAAHGLHLIGGVLALLYVAFRPTHRLTKGTATEVVSMYWHFMDGLWVFLFLLLLLGR